MKHANGRFLRWTTQAVGQAARDLRYALRSMRRSPGFTAAAILTLTLGIGANTAVFSVIDAVLLRPLGYPHPERIVQFYLSSEGGTAQGASIPDLRFWLQRAEGVQDISAYDFAQSEMGLTSGIPEPVHGIHVTSNYFRLFSAPILLGRSFTQADDGPTAPNVLVLSYGLWKRRFGGDERIIGKQISLDKELYTVIGVTGEGFCSEPEAQLWIPFHINLNSTDQLHSFGVAGRLKPGVTLAQANAQLASASLASRRDPDRPDADFQFRLRPLNDAIIGDVRRSLFMLQGAVSFVLLIACGNLANLLLIRMAARSREFAVRAAIGAGRGALLRQLTAESLLLCLFGCFAGILVGLLGAHALLTASPGNIPRIGESGAGIGLDWRVAGFAVAISAFSALIFGFLPALTLFRRDFALTLRETDSRQSAGVRNSKSRSLVLVTQVALSLVLLIGAALLVRTFIALTRVDPGFDRRNVLVMTMPVGAGHQGSSAAVPAMVREVIDRLAALPGIEGSAATFSPPFASRMGLPFESLSPGSTPSGDALWQAISPGYLQVLRIPILRGRKFDSEDNAGAPGVVLINEAMARQYWPGQNPVGREIVLGKGLGPKFQDRSRRIVGVVADTRDTELSQAPEPDMMIPDAQTPAGVIEMESQFGPLWWVIRTRFDSPGLVPAIAATLRQASGGRPVGSARTMDEILSSSIARQKFDMLLLAVFALAALLLAALGIYGVMAYSVAQRVHDIGVRMALGADRVAVRNLILREGLVKGAAGIAIGTAAAFFLARLLAGLLFGVSSRDPVVFVSAPMLIGLLVVTATWIPAHRAARLDPITALRSA
jgi:putative ABC transport system permease protein